MDMKRAKKLGKEIEAALQLFAKAHDLQIRAKGGSIDLTTLTIKIECAELAKDGVAQTPERQAFIDCAGMFAGLKPEHLDATFAHKGTTYRIYGLAPSRRRYPVIARRVSDDKAFKFPADLVVHALGEAA